MNFYTVSAVGRNLFVSPVKRDPQLKEIRDAISMATGWLARDGKWCRIYTLNFVITQQRRNDEKENLLDSAHLSRSQW